MTMRRAVVLLLLAIPVAGCGSQRGAPPTTGPNGASEDPFAVVAEANRLAGSDLWPGFDISAVPVAVYDGDRTLLFRHPAPPPGFERLQGREEVWWYPDRHPGVVANSGAEIGGEWTATVMPGTASVTLRDRAGVLIHEAFHVFQRARHPGWSANEVELFTYPVDDSGLLALRRMETEALRRALAAEDTPTAVCWTRTALSLRRERHTGLSPGAAAYERQTELNEGLAAYVQRRAVGGSGEPPLPIDGFAPEDVRQRAYRSGTALALLLDRFSPTWATALEAEDSIPLEVLLGDALPEEDPAAAATTGPTLCGFSPDLLNRVRATALADVESLNRRRAERRAEYLEAPGWRIVVTAPVTPLFPQGFDPLNVRVVAPGEVLHGRFLRLGNEAGFLEVIGRGALTESAGEHPLFNGVRRVVLTGFVAAPDMAQVDGILRITAEGLAVELSGAEWEQIGRTIQIELGR